jgi:hypothetical protein
MPIYYTRIECSFISVVNMMAMSKLKLQFSQKTKFGQEVGKFFIWSKHPFQCCATLNVLRSCESNFQILNLLQNPIIPWIAHRFVKVIQGQCVQTSNQKDVKLAFVMCGFCSFWWLIVNSYLCFLNKIASWMKFLFNKLLLGLSRYLEIQLIFQSCNGLVVHLG